MDKAEKEKKTDKKKDGIDFHLIVLRSKRKQPGQRLKHLMKDLERKYGQ